MTLICAMKFDAENGVLIVDEQMEQAQRKYGFAQKIAQMEEKGHKTVGLMGGAGNADGINDVSRQAKEIIEKGAKPIENGRDISQVVLDVSTTVKGELINAHLMSKFRITEREAQSGYQNVAGQTNPQQPVPLNQRISDHYFSFVNYQDDLARNLLFNDFILLTQDSKDTSIYQIAMAYIAKVIEFQKPYAVAGSGGDAADYVLSSFIEDMIREKRQDIDPCEGISALLYATIKADQRNVGVGGHPDICALRKGEIIGVSENHANCAIEIVKATKAGFLPKEFEREAIENLVYQKADWKVIEEDMWKNTKSPKDLSYFQRGYKV